MTTRESFSTEEWELLLNAPMQTAMIIVLASPGGPFSAGKEMWAVTKEMVTASQKTMASPLMRDLAVAFTDKATIKSTQPEKEDLRNPEGYKQEALANLKKVAGVLNEKASPEESEEIRKWLQYIAQKTAEAGKEGGFMGIGGVRVNEAEEAALDEIAAALGVSR